MSRTTSARWPGVVLGALIAALVLPATAGARVYWANQAANSIGVANGDGSGVNQGFVSGATAPLGVAVDGVHVYWAHGGAAGRIGRANLDGSGVNQAFVNTAGSPQGLAVDNLSVYWTQSILGSGHVGIAALDGTAINQNYLPTGPAPCGIAVDPDKEYWANGANPGGIGRAHGAFNASQGFVSGLHDPCGVADTPTYLYWAGRGDNTIGRARVDGTETLPAFLSVPAPCGVAVDGAHIYWTNAAAGTIGRANLDGSSINPNFITGAQSPCGISVDATVDPSPASYAFVATKVGAQRSQAFFIRDSSSSPMSVTRVAFAGPNPGDFVLTGDNCLTGVTPAAAGCLINVRFAPTREGPRHASLRLTSSAANSPTDIPLSGVASDARPPRILAAEIRPPTLRLHARRRGGVALAYALSKRARVTFTIARVSRGRLSGGRCRPSTRAPGGGRPCVALRRVGRLVHAGRAGPNRTRFSGRASGHLLVAGNYRVQIVARDSAGQRSKSRTLRLRVV